MKYYVPASLDLDKLILNSETIVIKKRRRVNGKNVFTSGTVKTKNFIKHLPYCYYLIHLITDRTLNRKDNVNGWVNLQTELLDKVIPHNTRIAIINLLSALKVIEVNPNYSIGVYSKSYRITDDYPLTDLRTIDLSQKCHYIVDDNSQMCHYIGVYNNPLVNNIDSEYVGVPKQWHILKADTRVQSGLKKMVDQKTVDLLRLPEYGFQQQQIFNINLDYEELEADGKSKELEQLIAKTNTGELSININNSVNRVFSPITGMKKNYRKYLRCSGGYSLLSIDFKTSHLFHLLKIIVEQQSTNSGLMTEVELIRSIPDIYQYVADQHLLTKGERITRCQAKDIFIQRFLYGKYPNQKISKWVCSLFPMITEFIKIKTRRALSVELQRSESRLINNLIIKRIALESDDTITVFGLFDGLIVDEDHFDQVFDIAHEESQKFFGYEVPLTVDDLAIEKTY